MPRMCPESAKGPLSGQSGLGERPPGPRELALVPPVERRERHALARRLDEPAVADVDGRVVDLRRLRPRPLRPEEEDVGGLEVGEVDPLRARYLAAHLVRRAAAEHERERAAPRVLLQLVDTPDEA